MKLVSFYRINKLGVINFWRNGWLSFANSIILTMTLLVITIFLIFNLVIASTTKNIEEKINVSVYFNDEISLEEITILQKSLEKRNDIKEVVYISKEDALLRWQNLQVAQNVKDQVTNEENPLPRSLEIKANSPESLDSIAQFLSKDSYKNMIRSISYQQNRDIIKKLINITKFSQKLGFVVSIIFVSISILVILNTVRLAVYTRHKEIEVMKIVGASNHFIDYPFIVESLLIAIIATILATLLTWLGLHYVSEATSRYLGDVSINLALFFKSKIVIAMLLELALGSIISIGCTLVSLRKHLKI